MNLFQNYLSLIVHIKANYRYLPEDIRQELNNVLQYYLDLSTIAKIERN